VDLNFDVISIGIQFLFGYIHHNSVIIRQLSPFFDSCICSES